MKCPECKTEENIKWFLRHQKTDEEDESTSANVVTILCTDCGKNESVFIEDFLPRFFPDWDPETKDLLKILSQMQQPQDFIEKEDETQENSEEANSEE